MFELKPLSKEGIAAALEKAKRYRLLNEPMEAESICLDILEVDPENKEAIIMLLLALTDQFDKELSVEANQANELLPRLKDEYERNYYAGIICERQAKAILHRGVPGSKHVAYQWFYDAMEYFQKAEAKHPPGNDDAILRWNTCARIIMQNNLTPRQEEDVEHFLE